MLNTNSFKKANYERNLWTDWTVAVSLGELVGFTVPAVAGAVAAWLAFSELPLAIVVIIAGAGEGAVLGFAQWLVLRHFLTDLKARTWVLFTALGAFTAWCLGMGASQLNNLDNLALIIGGWTVAGLILICTIGFAQWLILRHYFSGAIWWIPANAFAWTFGVLVPVVSLSLIPDNTPFVMIAFVGILSGLAMGFIVGVITGWVLLRFIKIGFKSIG